MELFTVRLPRSPEVPIVANLPHSGLFLPDLVTEQLLPEFAQALPHTDWHLDQLYRSLPDLGITLLQANYMQAKIDIRQCYKFPN